MGDLNLKLARVADTKAAMAALFRGRGLNPDGVPFRGYAGLVAALPDELDTELAALEAALAAQNTLVGGYRKDLGIRGGVNAVGAAEIIIIEEVPHEQQEQNNGSNGANQGK